MTPCQPRQAVEFKCLDVGKTSALLHTEPERKAETMSSVSTYADVVALLSVDPAWKLEEVALESLRRLQEWDTSPLGAKYFQCVPDAFDATFVDG